jgi:hypothetical protein
MRSLPARAKAEELLNNHMPPAIPSDPRRRFQGAGSLGSPCIPSLVSGFRMPKRPLLLLWEKGGRGDEGTNTHGNTRAFLPGTLPLSTHAGETPAHPAQISRCARLDTGRLFGQPLRPLSRFRLQDAQTPPSPLVGEGGRGDEGANTHGNVDLPPFTSSPAAGRPAAVTAALAV